jgi:membrane protein DedA with SNARE-associated domain
MTFLLGLLVPGESVVMLAGSLDSPAGFALAVIVGTVGGLLGQIGGYLIGRALGARLRDTRLGRRIGTERWNRAEAYLRDNGASALVAVRFVAVIHSVVPIVAGTARMPFGRFLGWSALGTVLWVSAFAGVGALTADVDSSGGIGLVLTAIGATCLGLIPLGVKVVRRLAPDLARDRDRGLRQVIRRRELDLRQRGVVVPAVTCGTPEGLPSATFSGSVFASFPGDTVRTLRRPLRAVGCFSKHSDCLPRRGASERPLITGAGGRPADRMRRRVRRPARHRRWPGTGSRTRPGTAATSPCGPRPAAA